MRRGMIALLAALSMMALTIGGCASKEVVKSEEPIVQQKSQPAPKAEAPKPSPPKPPAEQQPRAEEPRIAPPQQEAKAGSDQRAADEIGFDAIYFDFDKSDLRPDARDALNKNAEVLLKQTGSKVKIEGHCDERGSAEYNLALGERRAKSALQYLLTLGVPAERMSIISYGEEKPAVQGSDENAWAKNRRAEFVIVR